MKKVRNLSKTIAIGVLLAPLIAVAGGPKVAAQLPVTFSGGHETERVDRGRPVVLIANALGVKPEVFREAFSHVRPARGEAPTEERVHDNKRALLGALSQYGVTNERLDEVSNYYRYRADRREMWPTKPAKAYAVVVGGKVTKVVVTDPGSGYSSAPTVSVAGMKGFSGTVKLTYGKTLETNGGVSAVSVSR